MKNKKKDIILKYLSIYTTSISAEDLYIGLRTDNVTISITTLYRYLSRLVKIGMVKEERSGRKVIYSIQMVYFHA